MKGLKKVVAVRKKLLSILVVGAIFTGCGSDDDPEKKSAGPLPVKIIVDPSTTYQEMVGFGGALSWYSDRVIKSGKKEEITELIFNDLGADIIRFKSWYYPDDYPAVTTTASMSDDNSKVLWDATNQLYTLAKEKNSNVKILLSSWGPPAGLKSNGSSREGTLKKEDGSFMYDAYAAYWEHTLDNLSFNPDYISIQNEPTYTNAGWTTCQWSATETASSPGYDIAFDKVYEKIQGRENPPVMIGPESQDLPTFTAFAEALKNKGHLGMYAFHPYNINAGTSPSQVVTSLQTIRNYNNKPNMMTEYADNLSWFNTAMFIHNCLVHANSSGYIYWKLVWAQPTAGNEDAGMVSVTSGGDYTVTPFYYMMKHFSKHVDAGYKRVAASSTNTNLTMTAFMNPGQDQFTVVIINNSTSQVNIAVEITGKTIRNSSAYQSKEGSFYKALENTDATTVVIPAQTLTTVVLGI